jgi:hypothetical protein
MKLIIEPDDSVAPLHAKSTVKKVVKKAVKQAVRAAARDITGKVHG